MTPAAEIFERAAVSVVARGWHAETFMRADDQVLMAEMVCLGEEIGEFLETLRMNQPERAGVELADCIISLISVAMRLGIAAAELSAPRAPASKPIIVAYGALCRAVRRDVGTEHSNAAVEAAAHAVADAIWTAAKQSRLAIDLPGAISAKAAHDDVVRGYRHGGRS